MVLAVSPHSVPHYANANAKAKSVHPIEGSDTRHKPQVKSHNHNQDTFENCCWLSDLPPDKLDISCKGLTGLQDLCVCTAHVKH